MEIIWQIFLHRPLSDFEIDVGTGSARETAKQVAGHLQVSSPINTHP